METLLFAESVWSQSCAAVPAAAQNFLTSWNSPSKFRVAIITNDSKFEGGGEMNSIGARRWWALAALTLGVLAVGLDVTVLSVALPTLAVALKASESDLQWFSSGYALVLAAVMLPAGVLGDRFGRKRILLGSLVLFGAGSISCAYSVNPGQFIASRVLLGAAGGAIVVMALSVLTVLFSEEERPRAVGIWAAANFIALPAGPIFGGWLLTNFWWGWIFLMNVPVAALGMLAVLALVPESRAEEKP